MLFYCQIFLLTGIPVLCHCQFDHFPSGAQSQSVAGAAVTLPGIFSTLNNIACLSEVNTISLGASFQNKYGFQNLNSTAFLFCYPIKAIKAAVSITRFGDKNYHEQAAGLGLAHRIGIIGLGLKANIVQVKASEGFSRWNIVTEMGGTIKLLKNLIIGAHIYNINQANIKIKNGVIPISVILKSGVSYHPNKKLKFLTEIYKHHSFKPSLSAGIEYCFIEKILIRTGVANRTKEINAGIGFHVPKIEIDYAFSNHPILGNSHQMSIGYHLKK